MSTSVNNITFHDLTVRALSLIEGLPFVHFFGGKASILCLGVVAYWGCIYMSLKSNSYSKTINFWIFAVLWGPDSQGEKFNLYKQFGAPYCLHLLIYCVISVLMIFLQVGERPAKDEFCPPAYTHYEVSPSFYRSAMILKPQLGLGAVSRLPSAKSRILIASQRSSGSCLHQQGEITSAPSLYHPDASGKAWTFFPFPLLLSPTRYLFFETEKSQNEQHFDLILQSSNRTLWGLSFYPAARLTRESGTCAQRLFSRSLPKKENSFQ